MDRGDVAEGGLWVARGGQGARLLVLLHGMGANASVWERLVPSIERSWNGRWLAPDLRGHGRSTKRGPYGVGVHAADVAALVHADAPGPVTLVGHSLGGVVAALVASGWFGVQAREVVAIGVKIEWTPDEIAKAQDLARRPALVFATRDEAIARYLRASGLSGLAAPDSATAVAGVTGADGRFRIAMDPRAYGAVGPPVADLLRLADVPLRLASGAADPMVRAEHMRRIDPNARVFEGIGHNAHWEAPERVWEFIAEGAS